MKTQKGLNDDDIIVLISEDEKHVTFSVAFEGCEKFTKEKTYLSVGDYHRNIDRDVTAYQNALSSTTFTVHADEDEKNEVVNDSWGAIFGDGFGELMKTIKKVKK